MRVNKKSLLIFACCCVFGCGREQREAFAQLSVADFNSSDAKHIDRNHDKNVPTPSVRIGKNDLDDSPCLEFEATLVGPQAGWAGCKLPVAPETRTRGSDLLKIDARALGRTKGLFITLTESDGSRWNYNVRLQREWGTYELPIHRFTWFTGPKERSQTRPDISKLVSVDPWVGNPFQGANGFALDNVQMLDTMPEIRLRVSGNVTLPLQRSTTVTIEAVGGNGENVPVTGLLWLSTTDRTRAILPEHTPLRDGRATFEVFSRHSGPLNVFAYEPVSGAELRTQLITDDQGVQMFFGFEPFYGQQMIFAGEQTTPHFLLQGRGTLPLSAHVKVSDHVGSVIMAKYFSIEDLNTMKGRFQLSQAGLFTIDITGVREPLSQLPTISQNVSAGQETTGTITLPDGVTTDSVIGKTVFLEELPTTATIVARDKFLLTSLAVFPQENALWRSPFGICSGALYHLPMEDFPTTGLKRLQLHRQLASRWGRNDLWWSDMEPQKGSYTWTKASDVVKYYTENKINLLGILCYEPAWSPGKSPATSEDRDAWRKWVSSLFRRFDRRIKAYEVWNEPNHGFWKPAPDVSAYRELVKVTYEELRKVITESNTRGPKPKLGGGVTAGYDPVFFDGLLSDGYKDYLDAISFHPYPENHGATPEENSFGDICTEARQMLKKHAADKEIWLSEIGWPSGPLGVDEKTQANYMVRIYTTALFLRMNKVFWFNLYDWAQLPWEKGWDSHLGLFDWNYRPKPGAAAYNIMAYMLCRLDPKEFTRQGAAQIYSFDIILQSYKWPGRLHVAWTEKPGEVADVELKMVSSGNLLVFDYLGAERKADMISEEKPEHVTEEEHEHSEEHDHSLENDNHEEHDVTDGETSSTQVGDAETSGPPTTKTDDEKTTRTYRIRVTHEPVYIWDAGKAPKQSTHKH